MFLEACECLLVRVGYVIIYFDARRFDQSGLISAETDASAHPPLQLSANFWPFLSRGCTSVVLYPSKYAASSTGRGLLASQADN